MGVACPQRYVGSCVVLGKPGVGTALPLLLLPLPWNAGSICLHCWFWREHQQGFIQALDPALGSVMDPRGPAPACLSGRTRQTPALLVWGVMISSKEKGVQTGQWWTETQCGGTPGWEDASGLRRWREKGWWVVVVPGQTEPLWATRAVSPWRRHGPPTPDFG